MSRELTEDQRTELVEELISYQVENVERVSLILSVILEHGFKGFANYTDQELLAAYLGVFDEDFLENEE